MNLQTPGPLRVQPVGTRNSILQFSFYSVGGIDRGNEEDYLPPVDAYLLAASYNAFDTAARKVGVDATELANTLDIAEVISLLDGLSDMIEAGRLKRADIPDDYRWLVEKLAAISAPLPPNR